MQTTNGTNDPLIGSVELSPFKVFQRLLFLLSSTFISILFAGIIPGRVRNSALSAAAQVEEM